jgi:DMSO reductase iron-sulfur subunit
MPVETHAPTGGAAVSEPKKSGCGGGSCGCKSKAGSYEQIVSKKTTASIFPVRDNEPEYAKLHDPAAEDVNRYGNPIILATDRGVSLNINGVDEISPNPNRTRQHAFHFTADNCIGCHACESACSEKNDMPPHLSFRSVGYVEGGTYPNYTRMNISMACNHCDDPVCLKGCPTRAYTKHAEYGAVIQDPEICFGCGYCTWVCPYNAPQLDPVKGRVEKCNMCVDRLEVGLKPACVSACVGNALDFGVVENTPENREQIETRIPGFPDPSITKPNIRFQQIKSMPREMTRTDSMPIKYMKDDSAGYHKPMVDPKSGKTKSWNVARLSSRENPLVIFTLASQAAAGAFAMLSSGKWFDLPALNAVAQSPVAAVIVFIALGLIALGLLMSTIHLGKPMRFYRGFNNLRHSPVSREGLGIVLFMTFAGISWLTALPSNTWVQAITGGWANGWLPVMNMISEAATGLAMVSSGVALYYMYCCYRIKARPFWDHIHTAFTFAGNTLSLGALVIAVLAVPYMLYTGAEVVPLLNMTGILLTAGICMEGAGLYLHARDLKTAEHEGAASFYIQLTTFGNTYLSRNVLLWANAVAAMLLVQFGDAGIWSLICWGVLALSTLLVALVGRALFYVLVVPTTMPGAFFWKNKAFEQHARDIGLADMPQVGVAPLKH